VRYRKKTIIRITAFLLCVAALLAGAALLVHRKKALLGGAPRYGLAPTPVHVVAARRGSLEITRTYLSIVEPVRTATLSARLTSPIESVETDEGKTVRAGEPLIKLDDREISYSIEVVKAQIAQARAELAANEATVAALTDSTAFWKREAQRMKKVKASGAATESEMEALKGSETKGLTCGSYVPVTVVVRKIDDAILVPANSLVECPKEKVHVFVVREGKLAHPVVTVLGRGRDDVAIEGIRSGESVVTSTFLGWANLAGGMKVEPVK